MPVQLLPSQTLVDIPDLAQRHRRPICYLAITSIVLISIIMCLFVMAFTSCTIIFFIGIPSMVILSILVFISSFISLRNTDRWVSTDVCCNLMRSYPTCCTKSCVGSKHCCARMSCLHVATSLWASFFCVLLVVLINNATPTTSIAGSQGFSPGCGCEQQHLKFCNYDDGASGNCEYCPQGGQNECSRMGLPTRGVSDCKKWCTAPIIDHTANKNSMAGSCGCEKKNERFCNYDDVTTGFCESCPAEGASGCSRMGLPWRGADDCRTWCAPSSDSNDGNNFRHQDSKNERPPTYALSYAWPALILMICLVATTARSAWLLRQIEQSQPEIALLPAGKMVVQAYGGNVVIQPAAVNYARVDDDAKSKTVIDGEKCMK